MIARPVYVAVIGWVLIVIGALSLIVSGLIAASPDLAATLAPGPSPSTSSILLNLLASALELVCGIFIWRAFLAVTLAGLFTAAASRFFGSSATDSADAPETGIPDPAEPEPLQP